MEEKINQILTNQLCILATLETLGIKNKTLHPVQIQNIEDRIKETKNIRRNKYENKRRNN